MEAARRLVQQSLEYWENFPDACSTDLVMYDLLEKKPKKALAELEAEVQSHGRDVGLDCLIATKCTTLPSETPP